jgi:hypothetical protein
MDFLCALLNADWTTEEEEEENISGCNVRDNWKINDHSDDNTSGTQIDASDSPILRLRV